MAIFRQGPPNGGVRRKGGTKNRDFLFRPISCYISEMIQNTTINYYEMRIGNLTQAFQFIQCQITRKWYKIELYLQWPTNSKSYNLSNGGIFNDLERPLTPISRSRQYLKLNISETVQHT